MGSYSMLNTKRTQIIHALPNPVQCGTIGNITAVNNKKLLTLKI